MKCNLEKKNNKRGGTDEILNLKQKEASARTQPIKTKKREKFYEVNHALLYFSATLKKLGNDEWTYLSCTYVYNKI